MDDLIQCGVARNDFQQWLELGHAPFTIYRGEEAVTTLIRLQKASSVDYLYQIAMGSDNSISWNNGLTFCGVYDAQSDALYLAGDSMKLLTKGPAPIAKERSHSIKEVIAGKINQQVEAVIANDRKNLSIRGITGWSASKKLRDYLEHGAEREALDRFINGSAPDGLFHSGFTMDELPKAAFMAYLQNPEDFIQKEAERYIHDSQEEFFVQFQKNDALLAEYQALERDTGSDIHRMRAITAAVNSCGGKTVAVTIQKAGKELTFKMDAKGLWGYHSSYSSFHIAAPDRREFERLFGRNADYSPEDVIRITYGRNTIYEAAPVQAEGPTRNTGGMRFE